MTIRLDHSGQGLAPLSEQEVDELLLFADPDTCWSNMFQLTLSETPILALEARRVSRDKP